MQKHNDFTLLPIKHLWKAIYGVMRLQHSVKTNRNKNIFTHIFTQHFFTHNFYKHFDIFLNPHFYPQFLLKLRGPSVIENHPSQFGSVQFCIWRNGLADR